MSRRETARLARQTLLAARDRRVQGDHLLIFSEGSRSRSGAMQRVLAAIARYLEEPFATVVPFGVWGTERIVPLEEDRASVNPVCVRFGRAIDSAALFERGAGKRILIADALGYLTADLLPSAYRGVYGETPPHLAAARSLASSLT